MTQRAYTVTSRVANDMVFNFLRRNINWATLPIDSVEIILKLNGKIPAQCHYHHFESGQNLGDDEILVFVEQNFSPGDIVQFTEYYSSREQRYINPVETKKLKP